MFGAYALPDLDGGCRPLRDPDAIEEWPACPVAAFWWPAVTRGLDGRIGWVGRPVGSSSDLSLSD